ncbi:TrwC relaxase [Pseudonocardia dioxanivorans CB1190]|uniref:TrwC relaxase n=1 Tax=Pseudonocardia dioxanivorans (strain ATCC 55486 / DSM 44775 / JCM 13855 / CB1190) TaxID=675635 RepID=F4CK94_PSEUX|nr:MobF family relaxase [Pseudonocardia dioxanivorans]AEA22317.1 TrwC relaxase [Pseudonocardia dioxanivorans CB1190]
MVVVLKISNGYSPDYLLKQVATGRENYYTGAVAEGEPPGRWWGAGAERLGLRGLVEAQDMRAVYERFLDPRSEGFNDPSRWDEVSTLGQTGRVYKTEDELYAAALEREPEASAERRVELRTEAGKNARRNVAFYDATFSVQKSVTLLHTAFEAKEVAARAGGDEVAAAAWGEFRAAVEEAIWAGNNAGLTYLQDRAGYTRVGHHGGVAGRHADAHEWVVASFFQHDSRDHDPQLHIHNTILNRVEGPDGKWLAVDGRSLHRWRAAGAAVAERTTEERITAALGMLLATRPDGKAREVVGVSAQAMALVSSRRRALTAKAAELVADFETRYGRAPTSYERERIHQAATLVTREAKSHTGETRAQLLDRVDARIRADIAGGLAGVADAALAARSHKVGAQAWSPTAVMQTALADVQSRKSTWTRADLTAAINAALPDYLGLADGTEIATLLDELTEQALAFATPMDTARPAEEVLPAALRLANGDSAYAKPGGRLYSTPDHVRIEQVLTAAAAEGGAAALPAHAAARFLAGLAEQGIELGVDQAAAVRGVLTSGARIESLVGPAGTGKSFVVGAIARGWTTADRPDGTAAGRVFGLATSQVATDVLTGEGLTARNVARWLATQDRLAAPLAEGRAVGDNAGWALRGGDLVVVDESAMTDTAALAAIHRHVDAAGAKLLLVGDHKQLAAVGAGGGMDLLAGAGARYELAEARRFTAPWERGASLRLRAGDETVLRDYFEQGRLVDAGTPEAAEQSAATAWLADTLAGRRSLLLVDTNDQAAKLSAQLRAELVRLGRVAEDGVPLGLQGVYAGVGDLVQARRNGWHLAGVEGNRRGPINRETYRVTATRPDGSLEVAVITGCGPGGDELGEAIVLPADYVAGHIALGYASTVHAAQGATVDTSHTVVTGQTGPAALYVGMSRGRASNTAHVTTTTTVADPADGRPDQTEHRHPVAVLAGLLDPDDLTVSRSALATAADSAAKIGSLRAAVELLADAAQLAATERTASWLDQLTADGVLSIADRRRIAAEDGAASLTRILRRAELAGHNPRAVLTVAVEGRPLDGARNLTNVIYTRITDAGLPLDPTADTWAARVPRLDDPTWQTYLDQLAGVIDERTAALGAAAADEQPAWAVEAFGPPPADIEGGQRWRAAVAAVAAHRELGGLDAAAEDSRGDVLGRAPKPGQIERYAAYRAAWAALGRPEVARETAELSDGQLRMRIRGAARDEPWAPRFVGNELAATRQAADAHRRTATLRRAEADAATDPAEQTRLIQEATDATALAETLDARTTELERLDDVRARWLAHTAGNRAAADEARRVLADRHADTEPEPEVTAEEWLAVARAAEAAEDPYRDITDTDLTDLTSDAAAPPEHRRDGEAVLVETAVEDVREAAAGEPRPTGEDVVRVPSADEVTAALDRAARSLREIEARELAEQAEAEHRAAELNRWHTDDVRREVLEIRVEVEDLCL